MSAGYTMAEVMRPVQVHDERRVQLVRLLQLTEEMIECAQRQDWTSVDQIEQQRRSDLEACFAGTFSVDTTPIMAEAVAALIHLNERLVSIVGTAREKAAAAALSLRSGKSAMAGYRATEETTS